MAALFAPVCIVFVALAVRLPLLDAPGFMHDQEQFIIWAYVAQEDGLAGVYNFVETTGGPRRLSNYPPVQIYVCRALAALYPNVAGRLLDAEVIASVGDGPDDGGTGGLHALQMAGSDGGRGVCAAPLLWHSAGVRRWHSQHWSG